MIRIKWNNPYLCLVKYLTHCKFSINAILITHTHTHTHKTVLTYPPCLPTVSQRTSFSTKQPSNTHPFLPRQKGLSWPLVEDWRSNSGRRGIEAQAEGRVRDPCQWERLELSLRMMLSFSKPWVGVGGWHGASSSVRPHSWFLWKAVS